MTTNISSTKSTYHLYIRRLKSTYDQYIARVTKGKIITMKNGQTSNNYVEHGLDCSCFKNMCQSKNCINDQHHHNPLKKDNIVCIRCNQCHIVNMEEYLKNIFSFPIKQTK